LIRQAVARLTCAAGDDALPTLLLRKAGHEIVRASNFETEDLLKIFALEIDLISKFCTKIESMYERCLFENFIYP